MSKRFHILFEPIDGCELPIICVEADGVLGSEGQAINEAAEVPALFYQGQQYQIANYLGRITEPEKIAAWWTTNIEEESSGRPTVYYLLLKPRDGCAFPVISIEAPRAAADEYGRLHFVKDIPSLFWGDLWACQPSGAARPTR